MRKLVLNVLKEILLMTAASAILVALCVWGAYTMFLSSAGVTVVGGVPRVTSPMFPFSFWLDPLLGWIFVLFIVVLVTLAVKVVVGEYRLFSRQVKRLKPNQSHRDSHERSLGYEGY